MHDLETARVEGDHKFAIIKDRHYDGEGLTLWVWDGRYYCGTDGDCMLPRPDGSLDGFDCEWLTHYQLEQRLNASSADYAALHLTPEQAAKEAK